VLQAALVAHHSFFGADSLASMKVSTSMQNSATYRHCQSAVYSKISNSLQIIH